MPTEQELAASLQSLCHRKLGSEDELQINLRQTLELQKGKFLQNTIRHGRGPSAHSWRNYDDLNLYEIFEKDTKLVSKPRKLDSFSSLPSNRGWSSTKMDDLAKDVERYSEFSSIHYSDVTRMRYLSRYGNSIQGDFASTKEALYKYLLHTLEKAGVFNSKPLEEILWEIDRKKRSHPGKKVYVLLYDDWEDYLKDVYEKQSRVKSEYNGAEIIVADHRYSYRSYWLKKENESRTAVTVTEYASAVFAEDEINWNIEVETFAYTTKVPRKLRICHGFVCKPVFKFIK